MTRTLEERKALFSFITCGKLDGFVKNRLETMGFFTTPASTKFHGAYEGGLFDHSLAVTNNLIDLTYKNNLKWERDGLLAPVIIGLFHDLCKCDNYIVANDGTIKWNSNAQLKGHGDKSVILARRLFNMTDEQELCIRYHMGAFTAEKEWSEYTGAIHRYNNVMWTHVADMIASQIDGI